MIVPGDIPLAYRAMIDLMVAPSAIASPMGTEEYVRRLIRAFYSDRDLLLTQIHETESAPANGPRFPGVPMTVVSTRTYASKHELWAAKHFARLARQIEAAQTGNPKFNIQHRAFVTSAVRSAVGFLEAAINEVFSDVADGHDSYVAPLSDQCRQSMGSRWNRKTQRLKSRRDNKRPEILEKYQVALACSGNPVFEEDTQPYVDAELLISLRNRLTHARPETRAPSDEDASCSHNIPMICSSVNLLGFMSIPPRR
jgi:hypothetical protein